MANRHFQRPARRLLNSLGPNSIFASNLPFVTNRQISDLEYNAQRQGIERQASQASRLSDLANPGRTAADAYRDQLGLVQQLSALEKDNIARTSSGLEQQVLLTRERLDTTRQLQDAAYEFQLKSAEAVRQQFDSVKSAASSLLDTLFNKPKDFARQLGDTLRQALLKPVVDSLSSSIAQTLTLGRRAAFVGLGSAAMLGGGAAYAGPTGGLGSFDAPAAVYSSAPGSIGGLASLPISSIGAPGGFGIPGDVGFGGNPASIIGPGGTPGFASGAIGLGGSGLGGVFRSIGGKGFGNLASLKDTWFNQNINTASGPRGIGIELGLWRGPGGRADIEGRSGPL